MRYCGGAKLSWTLDKTNFSFSPFPALAPFPQPTPVLSSKFKAKTIVKVQKMSIVKEIFTKTPSPPTIKTVAETFPYFPWSSGGFCAKGMNSLEERSQSVATQSFAASLWGKVFLCWSDRSQRCCLSVPWKEELQLLQFTASTWHSFWHLQQRWNCSKKECGVFPYPQKKQNHKPSSSCYCFLVLELFCWVAIVLLFS